MEIYTVGRLAIPVVLGVITVAAFLTVVTMIFTAVKTIAMVERLTQQKEAAGRSPVTINIHTDRPISKPPMQVQR